MAVINIARIRNRIESLSHIGRKSEDNGITRLSYTFEYKKAMETVSSFMQEAGMTVSIDPIGNVIGRFEGLKPELPAVLVGSHLDTVPNGGALDGALGIITGIECVQEWIEAGFKPVRSIEVIATVEEEGTQFGMCLGTRAITGQLENKDPEKILNVDGHSLSWCLQQIGSDPNLLSEVKSSPEKVHCFVELHIEQGAELDRLGIPCGVVTDIVGIDRRWLTIEGKENHAGTTRMDSRQDALVAASQFISNIYQKANQSGGRYVATVGAMSVLPGAVNIIPGKVVLSIETRFITNNDFEEVNREIIESLSKIEEEYGVKSHLRSISNTKPVKLNDQIREQLCQAARSRGVSYIEMPSWAGHDAQILASCFPTGMIFVPSLGGISHSPDEATSWDEVLKATEVLNAALISLCNS